MSDPDARLWHDDFRDGFVTEGPEARWGHLVAGDYAADDGVVRTSPRHGLHVVASGTHPTTGEPAFVRTIGQEDDNGSGLPGTLDHAKWFAFPDHTASSGLPGFDAPPGRALTCEVRLAARTYGTRGHPFGRDVVDHDRDLRLASAGVIVVDPETATVFDFFLTDEQVFAFYERLPDARATLGHYAAFTYVIPVARRSPHHWHDLAITYDRAAGTVRWLVDGDDVFRVDRLGHRLDSRRHLAIDLGGTEQLVEPRQLQCGLGLLTLLDGALPGRPGLVRLSSATPFYFDPQAGEPAPQVFRDEDSKEPHRLFGQGAGLSVSRFVVSSGSVDG